MMDWVHHEADEVARLSPLFEAGCEALLEEDANETSFLDFELGVQRVADLYFNGDRSSAQRAVVPHMIGDVIQKMEDASGLEE